MEDLKKIRKNNQGKKIVLAAGCFDLIHIGHIYHLTEAKKLGGVLVVGIHSDEYVRRTKGDDRPFNPLEDRMEIVSALKPVDYVFPVEMKGNLDITGILRDLNPDVVVFGPSKNPAAREEKLIQFQSEYPGTEFITLEDEVPEKSTTNLSNKIRRE